MWGYEIIAKSVSQGLEVIQILKQKSKPNLANF